MSSVHDSIFLWDNATGAELAREVPREQPGGGFVTDTVIDQSVREASATTPSGIVRVSKCNGRWILDPNGIEAYIS